MFYSFLLLPLTVNQYICFLGSAINSLLINYLLLLLPDKHNGISYSLSIILYLFPDISLCHDKVKFQINIFTNCLEISYTLVILPFKMFPDAATLNVSNDMKIDKQQQ